VVGESVTRRQLRTDSVHQATDRPVRHPVGVPGQGHLRGATHHVPHPHRLVVALAGQPGPIRRPRHRPHPSVTRSGSSAWALQDHQDDVKTKNDRVSRGSNACQRQPTTTSLHKERQQRSVHPEDEPDLTRSSRFLIAALRALECPTPSRPSGRPVLAAEDRGGSRRSSVEMSLCGFGEGVNDPHSDARMDRKVRDSSGRDPRGFTGLITVGPRPAGDPGKRKSRPRTADEPLRCRGRT
jgi:hypothetical protein